MTSLTLTPVRADFVAEISDVDLRADLPAATIGEIVSALNRYAVVVFRDQPLSAQEQITFCTRFGPLDTGLKKVNVLPSGAVAAGRLQHQTLIDISNLDDAGNVAPMDSKKIAGSVANQLWHSDSSFQTPPGRYSMLAALCLPPNGGNTEFADMRAAYDALAADMQRELEGLIAEHFALHSRRLLGDEGHSQAQRDALPPVQWPIVRTHTGSGRKLLFIGAHTTHVVGLPVAVGRMLLADLLEHATQRAFVHAHEWRVNDVVIWDNRAVLHRGRRYDLTQRRELRRTTTLDVSASPGAA
jgi:alpha-ketoglutarate-dependent 2,4-dichlorophenoxyacetate dioxygenase